MYTVKKRKHVEDYFMPIEYGKNNYGKYKVNGNDIIRCFFDEMGDPKWEYLPTIDQLIKETNYELPKNKNMRYSCKQKFQRTTINVVNHLCEDCALCVVQAVVDIGKNKRRIGYGFTHSLQTQASSIERKIDRRDKQIERTKNRKLISNRKSLKLLKNEKERSLERRAII